MNIGIIGTGYVGLVAATCFADSGRRVFAVDSNPEKLASLKAGQVHFYEPGLEDLFKQNLARMSFHSDVAEITEHADLIFVAVGTPERPDGGSDMGATYRALEAICQAATTPKFVVLKSTVPVGTAREAKKFVREHARVDIEIINNPEFLRQGAALEDFLKPDRVVIGCESERARELMSELYAPFLKNGAQMIFMDNTSAEMTKYAANSFLALKISFINELALLCDRLGADVESVRQGFSSDHRINPSFFNAGIGYGGSCFPKDVRSLIHTAKEVGLDLRILQAADDVNERQKNILMERLFNHFKSLEGLTVGLWGLAFKPRTDDVRRAPSIKIIEELVRSGARVKAYDPVASENAKKASLAPFENCPDALTAARGVDALLIVTEWPEFKGVDLPQLKTVMKSPVILDGRNLFDPKAMVKSGFTYISIGRAYAAQS